MATVQRASSIDPKTGKRVLTSISRASDFDAKRAASQKAAISRQLALEQSATANASAPSARTLNIQGGMAPVTTNVAPAAPATPAARPSLAMAPGEREAMIKRYTDSGYALADAEKRVNELTATRTAAAPAAIPNGATIAGIRTDATTTPATMETTNNPYTSYNNAIKQLLENAQNGGGNEDLLKQRNALIQARFNSKSDFTPEDLRGLSPEQQAALRNQDVSGLETQLGATSAALSAREAKQNEARSYLKDFNDQYQAQFKPFEMNGNLVQLNPETGKYDVVYEAPAQAESQPATVQEYQYAVSQGYKGSFLDYQNAKSNATTSAKVPTQGAYDAYGFATRMDNSSQIIDALDQNFTGITGQGFSWIPEFLKSEDRKSIEQAEKDFLNAILRRESGAAISPSEFSSGQAQYFPQAGDSEAILEQKRVNRNTVLNAIKAQAQTVYDSLGQSSGSSGTSSSTSQYSPEDLQYFKDNGVDPSTFTSVPSTTQNGSIGSLSEKYESGGNPGAIGYDSTGGYSYGTYQLAHNNAKNFIEQSPYAGIFKGLAFNSEAWRNKWKDVAQRDPERFAAYQKDYIKKTHFDPQINKLASAGINVNSLNPVVLDAIWSTAVQHGPNTSIVLNALKNSGPNPQDQLKAIYNARWSDGKNFASSTPAVRNAVKNRFFGTNGELNRALGRLTA